MLVLGTTTAIMIFQLVRFSVTFPASFIRPGEPLNDFIKHYEPAFYNAEHIASEHRRLRRAAASVRANSPLKLIISTQNRVFKLLLRPDNSLFDENVIFESGNGKIVDFDPGKAYIGTLEDDDRAKVRGIVTKDGLFDGTITTQLEEFYVEPVSRFKSPQPSNINENNNNYKRNTNNNININNSMNYHTIVYKISDVIHPSPSYCASSRLNASRKPNDKNTIAYRSKRSSSKFPKIRQDSFKDLILSNNVQQQSSLSIVVNKTEDHKAQNSDGIYYDLDFINYAPPSDTAANTTNQNFDTLPKLEDNNNNNFGDANNETTADDWKRKYGVKEPNFKSGNNTSKWKGKITAGPTIGEKSIHNIEYSNTYMDKMFFFSSDYFKRSVIVDPKKTTCMLYLQADHLFYEKYGTEETCIEVMTRHVQRVNSIYKNTDFNQDGKPDNISFMIKRIKVHTTKDSSYRFPGNYGVEKFLEIFSEEDYDAFCLAYMFTYRDFEMGTLGLAWTGDLRNAGGVCEKNGHYRGSLKSLNTGIVTVLNYGKHVPSAVSHVTLAHEIGHNFGSPHDPDGCTPGGDDGNFIMFARATSGDKKNNNKFSQCSLNSIDPVLNIKARSVKGCFTAPQRSICGNGVVEPGEECDCGWEEDCQDKCCYPQRRYSPPDEPPCHLTPNSLCSPSQGPCCSSECSIKFGDLCRSDNGCRDATYCDGRMPSCPPSNNKPNKTVCNEEFVCYMGECTGSICLAYGLESCQCIPTPSDLPTKACELCCKMPGENQPCLSSFLWNSPPYDVPDMFAKPGTPCNDYNGYCDVFRKCREVDPSGPLATLRKLLLSEENISSLKKWAFDHWYYTALIIFTVIFAMILSTKYLGKNPKAKTVTVMHNKTPTTEVVRLPSDDNNGGAAATAAVRSKKKKVRDAKHKSKHVKNKHSPKKRKSHTKQHKDPNVSSGAAAAGDGNNVVVGDAKIKVDDDPIGKVRNWLIAQNNNSVTRGDSLRKTKSSPVLTEEIKNNINNNPNPVNNDQNNCINKRGNNNGKIVLNKLSNNNTEILKPPEAEKLRLQVVYKPPFKLSLKLRQNRSDVSSHLVREKRIDDSVRQKSSAAAVAPLVVRADHIRISSQPQPTTAQPGGANNNISIASNRKRENFNEKLKSTQILAQNMENKRKSLSPVNLKAIENSEKRKSLNSSFTVKNNGVNENSKIDYRRSISAPVPEPIAQLTDLICPSALLIPESVDPNSEPIYANAITPPGLPNHEYYILEPKKEPIQKKDLTQKKDATQKKDPIENNQHTTGGIESEPQYINLIPRNQRGSMRSNFDGSKNQNFELSPSKSRPRNSVRNSQHHVPKSSRYKNLKRSSSALSNKQSKGGGGDKIKRNSLQIVNPSDLIHFPSSAPPDRNSKRLTNKIDNSSTENLKNNLESNNNVVVPSSDMEVLLSESNKNNNM